MPQLDSPPEFLEPYYDNMIGLLPRVTRGFPFLTGAVLKPTERHDAQQLILTDNLFRPLKDSRDHAAQLAIRYAQQELRDELGVEHLPKGTWLYSNCEPCMMCARAIANAFEKDDDESGLVYGVFQKDLRGQTAIVRGEKKPYRTTQEDYDSTAYITRALPKLQVVSGLKRKIVAKNMGIVL